MNYLSTNLSLRTGMRSRLDLGLPSNEHWPCQGIILGVIAVLHQKTPSRLRSLLLLFCTSYILSPEQWSTYLIYGPHFMRLSEEKMAKIVMSGMRCKWLLIFVCCFIANISGRYFIEAWVSWSPWEWSSKVGKKRIIWRNCLGKGYKLKCPILWH